MRQSGVLFVHGFTGSPFEVRFPAERLAARGFHCVGPQLAGHETRDPRTLDRTRWEDWVGSAGLALDALRRVHAHVAIVGMSLGGLIALHLAAQRPGDVAAIASLGAPLWLPGYARVGVPLFIRMAAFAPFLGLIPKAGGSDVRDAEMRRQSPAMTAFPIHAVASLIAFTQVVRAELERVTVPAFVAHGVLDRTAPFASLAELERRLGSRDLTVLELPASGHVISIDVERERLADELYRFLSERIP